MSKDRVKIRNGKPVYQLIEQPPNAKLVNHLEKILVQAKSGNARSIISVVQYADGETTHGWLLDKNARENSLMGAMFTMLNSISFTHTHHYDKLVEQGIFE